MCKGRVCVACKVALDQSAKVSLEIVGNYNRPTTQISLKSGHEDVFKLIVLFSYGHVIIICAHKLQL